MADAADNHGAGMQAHEATWKGFVALMKWGTVFSFLIGFGVVLLIAS